MHRLERALSSSSVLDDDAPYSGKQTSMHYGASSTSKMDKPYVYLITNVI